MTKDEAMKLALDALESASNNEGNFHDYRYAATALRQAIEQAEKQEYSKRNNCPHCEREFACNHHEWVGLTQEDIDIAFDDTQEGGGFDDFARAIEAKLKENNT